MTTPKTPRKEKRNCKCCNRNITDLKENWVFCRKCNLSHKVLILRYGWMGYLRAVRDFRKHFYDSIEKWAIEDGGDKLHFKDLIEDVLGKLVKKEKDHEKQIKARDEHYRKYPRY